MMDVLRRRITGDGSEGIGLGKDQEKESEARLPGRALQCTGFNVRKDGASKNVPKNEKGEKCTRTLA
jgi:hypothetical protein